MRERQSLNSSATLHFDLKEWFLFTLLEGKHLEKKNVPHTVFPAAHNSLFILSS